jgi:eukaryotic-like serine/threonine-protein kinase
MGQAIKARESKTRKDEAAHRGGRAPLGGADSPQAVDRRPGPSASDSSRSPVTPLEETALHRPAGSERVIEKIAEPDVEALVGRRIGQYRVDSVLGRGTMAWVFKAKHLGLGRPCALKVMDPGLVARQPGIRAQFWAEARAAANLMHPHVVTIHNLGSVQGFHFIEMEYIRGGRTLRDSLVREGPLEPVRASTLARQVVLALGAAHEAGLVHRDIKPANVLLTPDGRAKLADFGLVRRLDEPADGGAPLAGTPTFMAPELFRGTPASPRSDFYALGVLLFHALSGRLPFTADNIGQLIRLHRNHPVPDLRQFGAAIPDALVEIVEKCLAKSPDDRFKGASELADALQCTIHRQRDTESLVREAAKGLDCFIQGYGDTFRVILTLPGDRLQEVVIEVDEGKNKEQFISVFSVCGPADPAYFRYALTINAHLTFGSISIHDVLGSPMFVMSRTFSRDTVRTEDLRDALLEIGRRADLVEKQLTRLDQY